MTDLTTAEQWRLLLQARHDGRTINFPAGPPREAAEMAIAFLVQAGWRPKAEEAHQR